MRAVLVPIITVCSFLYLQLGIAGAEDAPAWIVGEYAGTASPPKIGNINIQIQIKDVSLTEVLYRNDRNLRDWTKVRAEAKSVSPDRVKLSIVLPTGTSYDLVAKPDGSMEGTLYGTLGSESIRFTKK